MKVILALGNPGEKYVHTRHNAGFLIIDHLAAGQSAHFSNKPKFFADIAELNSFTVDSAASTKSHTTIPQGKILLVKPTTYYNEVGIAARAIMDFYKLTLDDLLIIHDRIGTDNLLRRQVSTDRFVMMNFNSDELTILKNWTIPTAQTMIHDFLSDHISAISVKL